MQLRTSGNVNKVIRMGPETFGQLCELLQTHGGLKPTQRATVEEQVAKFLHILSLPAKNGKCLFFYRRSGETISRHFHRVLKAVIAMEAYFLRQPSGEEVPIEILSNERFYPYFKDCVGAIDRTHVRVKVFGTNATRYCGRKDHPTQNVLAACSFDLKFTYVLLGWDGTASDSRIIKNALTREDKLVIPKGKFYLVDAGFMLKHGLITPYRGVDPDVEIIKEVDEELTSQNPPEEQTNYSQDSKKHKRMKKENMKWTLQMDNAFIEAMLNQHYQGFRVDGTFTTTAYNNIIKELKEKLGMDLSKMHLKNRMKTLKDHFNECYDLFRNGKYSGFSWSYVTKTFHAEDEVWDQLLKGVETAKEKRKRWAIEPNEDQLESFVDVERLLSENEITLESFDTESSKAMEQVLKHCDQKPTQGTNFVKGKKRKVSVDEKLELLKGALENVTNAIREGNCILQKSRALVYSEDEIYSELLSIGVEEELIDDCYLFLIHNPNTMLLLNMRLAVQILLIVSSSGRPSSFL
ncbi:Myb/SANT-like domain [Dillenia turbinata]|uniref:Myb/SANT-like domain n=1 Tax=Dillenia turbinata TaxID=194707 RepID=A0AAN8W406_9MAGN